MLRSGGVEISAIACARPGYSRRTRRWCSMSESGTAAPIARPSAPARSFRSAAMRERPMTTFGVCWRRFMFG